MWMQLLVSLVMMVISSALQAAAAPKAQAQEPEAGKLDVPTAEEGGAIPVVFGTCIIKTSNVVWYGDAKTTPIKQSAGSGGKK